MRAISLRHATLDDARRLFEWRNHPETRKFFFDPGPIVWGRHLAWLAETLANPQQPLLIGESGKEEIGVLRYDATPPRAEVSIYLVPGMSGRGLGGALLRAGTKWMSRHAPSVEIIRARVLQSNIASRKAFVKAGFKEADGEFVQILRSSTGVRAKSRGIG